MCYNESMTTEQTALNPHEILARAAKARRMAAALALSERGWSQSRIIQLATLIRETAVSGDMKGLNEWFTARCPLSPDAGPKKKHSIDTWLAVADRVEDGAAWVAE